MIVTGTFIKLMEIQEYRKALSIGMKVIGVLQAKIQEKGAVTVVKV